MKYPLTYSGSLIKIIILIVFTSLAISCENRGDIRPKADILTLPSVSVLNSKTVFTDSGLIQLEMTFPIMEQYDNTENPYNEFRSGIKVIFYDGHPEALASVTAKYAKYTKTDNLWELKDSVIVINEGNDMLETELLYWNQQKDLIYTDRFVKITSVDQIMQGYGFESDSHLNNRKVKKVSATIYLSDEE